MLNEELVCGYDTCIRVERSGENGSALFLFLFNVLLGYHSFGLVSSSSQLVHVQVVLVICLFHLS